MTWCVLQETLQQTTVRGQAMKQFHWDLSTAPTKYRECGDDPFRFSEEVTV